jgi:tRNA pseudouridine65 synthase
MLLHAERVAFAHPFGGERIEARAPPDAEFEKALALFEAQPPPETATRGP